VGYRFGEHRYSEGRYSRWPDWWHDKVCQDEKWDTAVCESLSWQTSEDGAPEAWTKTTCKFDGWTPRTPPVAPQWALRGQQLRKAPGWHRTR
jgi:hypothetical protein